ncbi:MAG: hypothetical protein EAX86_10570 [Candidatus Heimdallarchaeota archaeon]|nr:hypothetical protein [Candidatus Heimdallarchaeota archaeon]
MDEWEISFDLVAGNRAEHFQFKANSLKETKIPSFPKDKFLKAIETHGLANEYRLHMGKLGNLKFKNTPEYTNEQEIHILMLVLEKLGPISLILRQTFEHLTVEGIDSHYNYLGYDTIVSILLQVIKPDNPPIPGLGAIKTVYYASNEHEIKKREKATAITESFEGKALIFSLSIILPSFLIIILPIDLLDDALNYIIVLSLLSILWCIYPIAKRSIRHAPLSILSMLISYLTIELLIHLGLIRGGLNPWGIFNNISRQNLVGILQGQDLISDLGGPVFLGIEILQFIIPFFDFLIMIFIPFTIGIGVTGIFSKYEIDWKAGIALRIFFMGIFLIFILILPLGYHALGKGTEGTLHTSIGLLKTVEMFSPEYIDNLEENYEELLQTIASAQYHLSKAGNSFQQFGDNPLIAYILPLVIPEIAGIPFQDLPEILTLTRILADSIPYLPNVLWGYNHLQNGLNQSLSILQDSIIQFSQMGIGSAIFQEYDTRMHAALAIMQLGLANITLAELPLLDLLDQVQEKLDYSVFSDISNLLTEIEISTPILLTVISSTIPWINSTYGLSLALESVYNYDFSSEYLNQAQADYEATHELRNIDLSSLPSKTIIPIRDLVNFSLNLNDVTKNLLFAVQNASSMFESLNSTLSIIETIDFTNTSNTKDPAWQSILIGLSNTGVYLRNTQNSLTEMTLVLNAQIASGFEELADLNEFLLELQDFTQEASDRFTVVDQYYSALNGTYYAINYFSKGSNALNESITEALQLNPFDATAAINNFTLCQELADSTDGYLKGITVHLLNETSVENWRQLVKGNISDVNTNSIYMNAKKCNELIQDIEITLPGDITSQITTFQQILINMETLDWDIFAFTI